MFRPVYDPDTFFHWTELQVRFRDLDPLNHANNALFNTYLEEARIRFLAEVGHMQSQFTEGKTFVLAKCTIEYLKQISFPSTLLIGSGISKVGNSSINIIQGIYDKESKELMSMADSKGVWFDINKQRPTRLPEIEDLDAMMIKEG